MGDLLLFGDVIAEKEANEPRPLAAEVVWAALKAGANCLRIDNLNLSGSRWALSPRLVLGLKEGRACVWVEGRGGATGVLVSSDPNVAKCGYLVHGNTVFPFERQAAGALRDVLDDLGIAIGPVSFPQALAVRKSSARTDLVDDRLDVISPDIFGVPREDNGVPDGVAATLYPYQLEGWAWLRFLALSGVGGLLGDEMGLGKTLQIISLLSDPGVDDLAPSLIVAPGTLLENWRREFAKFASGVNVLVHHGPERTGRPAVLESHDVVITSYDSLVRDLGLFGTIQWRAVVIDEAQAIRNPDAKRTSAVCALGRDRSFAVTGTPLENRLMDIWSVMNFVAPGYLGTRDEFDARFGDTIEGAAHLEPLFTPLMLRRRVRDVAADLPGRIDIDVPLLMPHDLARSYEDERQATLAEYGRVGPLVAITKLRRFCALPRQFDSDWQQSIRFPKLERTLEIMEEIAELGEKVIVFSSFTEVSDVIADAVRGRLGIWTDVIDGRVPLPERQPLIDAFGDVSGAACLILNPRVGGAGLNITAANHVIHYGLEWNPALEAQASARAWRRGQTLPVTVHRLFFSSTVEEVMNDRLLDKQELGEAAVLGVSGKERDHEMALRALAISPMERGER